VRVGLQLEELGTVLQPNRRRTSSASGDRRGCPPGLTLLPPHRQREIQVQPAQLEQEDDPAAEAAAWEGLPRADSASSSEEAELGGSTAQRADDGLARSLAAEAPGTAHQAAVVAFTPSALASDAQQRPDPDVLWPADLAEVNTPGDTGSSCRNCLPPDSSSASTTSAGTKHTSGARKEGENRFTVSATQAVVEHNSVLCTSAAERCPPESAQHGAVNEAFMAGARMPEAAHTTHCAQPDAAAQRAVVRFESFASERVAAAQTDAAVQWCEHVTVGVSGIRRSPERADAGFQCAGVAAAAMQADVPLTIDSGCQTLDRHARTTQTSDDRVAAVAGGTSRAQSVIALVLPPEQATVCQTSCQTEQQVPEQEQLPSEPYTTRAVITVAGDGAARPPGLCANPEPSPVEGPPGFWSRAEVQAAWELEDWKRAERARFVERMQARRSFECALIEVRSAQTTGVRHCQICHRPVCQYC